MRLIKTEANRFFSRRFIMVMMIALVAAFGLTVLTVMSASETPSAEAWSYAREEADRVRADTTIKYQNCLEVLTPSRCDDLNPAHVETEDFIYGTFNFRRSINGLMFVLAAFLALFGYLVTASFIGSELHSGGMTNLLLWRPERLKVLGTKLGVALAAITLISAVFTVIYVGMFYGIAATTGWVGYLPDVFWEDLTELALRIIGLTLVGSVVAFSIATIGRHTAAALGALRGYIVAWEGGARVVLSIVFPEISEYTWYLSSHIAAWLVGGFDYWDRIDGRQHFLDLTESGLTLGTVALLFALLAFTSFKRRDIA